MILVSHDLAVITEVCDRIIVMYAGQVVEEGDAATIITEPRHPYTQALLDALPQAGQRGQLRSIPGAPPSLIDVPAGLPVRRPLPARHGRVPQLGHRAPGLRRARVIAPAAGGTTRSERQAHGRQAARHRRRRRGPVGELGAPARLDPGRAMRARRGLRHRSRAGRSRQPPKFGARVATTDYGELLRRDDIDIIDVVTSDSGHFEINCAAIEAGKHVLSEKPVAHDFRDVRRVAAPRGGQRPEDQGRLHVPVQPGGPVPEGHDQPGRPRHAVHLQRLRAELAVAGPEDAAAQRRATSERADPGRVAGGLRRAGDRHRALVHGLRPHRGGRRDAQLHPGADDRATPGRWPGRTSTTATSSSASSPAARSARCRAASSPSATTRGSRCGSTAARARRSPGWSRSSASARR